MAIAFDTVASYPGAATGVSSATFTGPNITAGLTNSILIIGFGYFGSSITVNASSVTYNGSACTKIRRDNDGVGLASSELWYILNPTSGAHAIVITLAVGATNSGSDIPAGAICLSGVDQANPIDAQNGSVVSGTHTTHADSVTTVAANAWIVDVMQAAGTSFTANGSQNARYSNPSATFNGAAGSTLPVVTPAATSVGWSFSSTGSRTAHSAASFTPAASAAAPVGVTLSMMGVG